MVTDEDSRIRRADAVLHMRINCATFAVRSGAHDLQVQEDDDDLKRYAHSTGPHPTG